MNLLINTNSYDVNNLYIMDPVSNNVLDNAVFYRLLYSNSYMTMNSLYFKIKLSNVCIVKLFNKFKISFNHTLNKQSLDFIKHIESTLLNKFTFDRKTPQYCVNDVINSDNLKLYSNKDNLNEYNDTLEIYLKISGFWMKDNIYGITYKFSY